jgi:CubicO group peptidase (beta-lactamase class C family)
MRKRAFSGLKQVFLGFLLAVLCFSLSGLPALAQGVADELNKFPLLSPDHQPAPPTEQEPIVPPLSNRTGPSNLQEVETFMDKFFAQEMPKEHVPGAVVSLVKGGEILFTKGYGYANVEKKIPVDPETTLFRVASLSKLFTDTATMQLYERGALELDRDINQYLQAFQVENKYPQPITAAHLMTQTSGISRRLIGIAADTEAAMSPLEEFLSERLPPIILPPGEVYFYSNTGITLLGYLVQQVSGVPFIQYIDENILQPLDMRQSTFLQPLPPALDSNLAVGYQYKSGKFHPVPFLYLNIFPAASLSTTATDMAHFMIAHLLEGRYENSRILEEDTVRLMHRQHFTHHPLLPGSAYGFHERLENNLRTIGHAGNLRGYSSSITLLPDQDVGLFIATNNFNGIHEKLINQFLDHYYPVQNPSPLREPDANLRGQLERFTRTYWDFEYPRDTFLKLGATFGHINIKKGEDNTLLVSVPGLFSTGGATQVKLAPIEPMLFQRTDNDDFTAFGEDSNGRIKFAFNPIGPKLGAFERAPWYLTIWWQLGLAVVCALVFLSACIVWPIVPIIRSLRGKGFKLERRFSYAWLVAGLVGTLHLLFIVGLPLSLWFYGVWKLIYGVPAIAIPWFYLPPIAIGLSIALLVLTVLAWKNKYWSIWQRSHYSLITLAAFAFIPFLVYWNFLGLKF